MKQREPPSALLVLSAIDLLLASLVCAVVLLIALVGSVARSSVNPTQTISLSTAPTTLNVLFHMHTAVQGVTPATFKIEGADELLPPIAANRDSLSYSPFGLGSVFTSDLHWWTLVVKPDAMQLTFSGIPDLVVATINLGTQGMYYLFLRCRQSDWTLKLGLQPLRVIEETCSARDATGLVDTSNVPATPRIIVTASSPSSSAWRHLASMKNPNGMISAWVGPDKAIPADASTIVFTD